MYIFGHIGLSLIVLSLLGLPFIYGILGALTPDLIDKPLKIVGITDYGRHIGHTLFSFVALSIVFHILFMDLKKTLSFSIGYLTHFLGDIYTMIPILIPFRRYDYPTGPFRLEILLAFIFLDLVGLSILVAFYLKNKRFRRELTELFSGLKSTFHHFLAHFL